MPSQKEVELSIEDLTSEEKYHPKKRLVVATVGIILALLAISGLVIYLQQDNKTSLTLSPLPENIKQGPTIVPSPTSITYQQPREVIGFLPSWMIAKKVKVYPQHLTQLIYFGLGVNENGDLIKYKNDGSFVLEWTYFNSPYFKEVLTQSRENKVKILIAIKNFDNESIDNLVSSQTATYNFTNQIINLINEFELDGVNIDFEYVTKTDFPTAKFFNRFLEIFISEIKAKDPDLIVSVDLNATGVIKDPAYDLVKIGELADQTVLMGYDFHRTGSYNAGPVAPLEAGPLEHSIGKVVRSLKGRVPPEKLILAIPLYGYEWQTTGTNYKSITIPNSGALATYGRVHDLITSRDDVQINWEEKAQSPWLVYRQSGAIKQIYYENTKSIGLKVKFANEQSFAGIAIWALGYEGDYQEPWEVIEKYINN